jgi:hypothetical protein
LATAAYLLGGVPAGADYAGPMNEISKVVFSRIMGV